MAPCPPSAIQTIPSLNRQVPFKGTNRQLGPWVVNPKGKRGTAALRPTRHKSPPIRCSEDLKQENHYPWMTKRIMDDSNEVKSEGRATHSPSFAYALDGVGTVSQTAKG